MHLILWLLGLVLAAPAEHGVAIYQIKMEANAQLELPVANPDVNRSIYFYKGDNLKVAGTELNYFKAVDLVAHQVVTLENGNAPGEILLLQGQPIKERVVQHGPFVMNSEQEIYEAMDDFQRTQWGGWPWPNHEHVHAREKGRFALHADGKLEEK